MTLARFIKEQRELRGLSQTELASISGLSISFISRLEAGQSKSVTVATLGKLAKALKVPFNQMRALVTTKDDIDHPYNKTPDEIIRELNASLPATIPIHDALNSKKIISYAYVPKVLIKGGKMHGLVSPVDFEDIIRKGDILLCSEEITPQAGDIVIYSNGTNDNIAKYSKKMEKMSCCTIVQSIRNFRAVG